MSSYSAAMNGGLLNLDQMKMAIWNYYQTADNWEATAQAVQSLSPSGVYNAFSELPNVTNIVPVLDESGEVIGTAFNLNASTLAPAELGPIAAAAEVNSNVIAAESRVATLAIPQNATVNATTGALEVSSGATAVATGSKAMVTLGNVASAIAAAGIGMQLGVWIDAGLYHANPDFWDSHNMSELNPETWQSTTIGNWLVDFSQYDKLISLMDETGQTYIDENAYAVIAQYLAAQGAFEGRVDYCTKSTELSFDLFNFPQYVNRNWTYSLNNAVYNWGTWGIVQYTAYDNTEPVYIFVTSNSPTATGNYAYFAISKAWFNITGSWSDDQTRVLTNGETIHYRYGYASGGGDPQLTGGPVNYSPADEMGYNQDFWCNDIPILLYHGDHGTEGGVDGINPYSVVPTGITPDMTPQQVIDLLRQQYPDLFNKELKQGVLQPDGTIKDKYYLPYNIPSGGTDTQPTTSPNDSPVPDPNNEPQARTATETAQPPNPSNPTGGDSGDSGGGTGGGTTPPVIVPSGSAEALYSVYNPTNAEINSFGAWLWSPNFVDQLLKMFNDPMQAIIGLHKIFLTPSISGRGNIVVGYLDSGVGSNIVSDQYTTHDCGYVSLAEVFGNVFDYSPYTKVEIYLPFYGIARLNVADVMRGTINVIYRCDVLTGDLFIEIRVKRDGHLNVLYTFNGNCAVRYPLSSMSYMALVSSTALAVGGTIAGAAIGGPMGAGLMLAGVGTTAKNALGGSGGAEFGRSGSIAGNVGAMGGKKPYLIITRPQLSMASRFPHLSGYPSNKTVILGSCSGYAKVKYVHTEPITTATDVEKREIERMLMNGVLI